MSAAAAEVTQTIIVGDASGRQGNCLAAAVASLLGLPLDEVPHFAEADDWWGAMASFARTHGYAIDRADEPPKFGLAFGPSPRGVTHAVVILNGETAWDPHPSRAGLLSASMYVRFELAGVERGR